MLRILFALLLSVAPALAAQQPVYRGATPNDGTGDSPYSAFGKLNANDAELYASVVTLTTAVAGKQPASALLTAIAGLTTASDQTIYFTGPGTAAATSFPAFARSLAASPSSSAARTILGLGGAALLSVGTATGTVAAGDDPRLVGAAQKSANLSDLASSSAARTNLGLGGSATLSVGATTGTVAAGDDSRIAGSAQKSANLSDLASVVTARTNLGAAASGANTDITSLASPALGAATATTQSAGDSTTKVATTAWVNNALGSAGTVPPGAVSYFATSSCPSGWLENDGAAIARTGTFAVLYAAIGTIWGTGDGSTTFNKPDMRGQFIRAYDHGRGVDSGRALASTQADMVGSHTHGFTGTGASNGTNLDVTGSTGSPYNGFALGAAGGPGTLAIANSTGTETRPKNVAMLSCIKF